MATEVNQEIVGTSKYYKIDLLFYIFLAVIAVITNLIFIPKFGITGAAMASAISIFLFNTIRFFFLLYVFRIQPFSLSTLKVLAVFVLTFLISYLVSPFHNFILDIFLRSLLIIILFGGLVLLMNVSEDVGKVVDAILKRIKNFLKNN